MAANQCGSRDVGELLHFLATTSDHLAASLDYEATLRTVARAAVPYLADWCAVDTVMEDGSVQRLAVAHADPAKELLASSLQRNYPPEPGGLRGVPEVLRTGEPVFAPDLDESQVAKGAKDAGHLELVLKLGCRSYMCVPLKARGRILGALSFVLGDSGRRFGVADLELAQEVAYRAAVAIDNARLYSEVRMAEARYRAPFESVSDAILVTDDEMRPVDMNQAMCKLTGYTLDELREGRHGGLTVEGGQWERAEFARLKEQGCWRGGMELRRKDGAVVPVESRVTAIQHPRGTLYVGVLRDIWQRKAWEQEISRALLDTICRAGINLPTSPSSQQHSATRGRTGRARRRNVSSVDADARAR